MILMDPNLSRQADRICSVLSAICGLPHFIGFLCLGTVVAIKLTSKQERNNTMNNTKARSFTRCLALARPWMLALAFITALALFVATQIATNHNRFSRVKQWLDGNAAEVSHE